MLDPVRPPCLQLTGALYVPTNGSYTLWLCSDDGSRLWLNDQLLVDNGGLVSWPCRLPCPDHALRSAAALASASVPVAHASLHCPAVQSPHPVPAQ